MIHVSSREFAKAVPPITKPIRVSTFPRTPRSRELQWGRKRDREDFKILANPLFDLIFKLQGLL